MKNNKNNFIVIFMKERDKIVTFYQENKKLPGLTHKPVSSEQHKHLSPFTWTHIKLPNLHSKTIQLQVPESGNKKMRRFYHQQKSSILNKQLQEFKTSLKQRKRQEKQKQAKLQQLCKKQLAKNSKQIEKIQKIQKQSDLNNYLQLIKEKAITRNQKKRKSLMQAPSMNFDAKSETSSVENKSNTSAKQFSPVPKDNSKKKQYKRLLLFNQKKAVIDNSDPRKNILNRSGGVIQDKSFQGSPPNFIQQALLDQGWIKIPADGKSFLPILIWTSQDNPNHYQSLYNRQFYNHIQGGHHLTTKNLLHKSQSLCESISYPNSYCFPQQTQSFITGYETNLLKCYLKAIIKYYKTAETNFGPEQREILIQQQSLPQMCLSTLLQKILPTQCKQTLSLISLCLFFEKYRREMKYSYFENMEEYAPVKVNVSRKIINNLTNQSLSVLQALKRGEKGIQFEDIDQRLIILLFHYDLMLRKFCQDYNVTGDHNIWLVKPIAGSKGKGISFFSQRNFMDTRNQIQLELNNHLLITSYKLTSKYANKIIQKYIERPYLINLQNLQNEQEKEKNNDPDIIRQKSLVKRFSKYNNKKFDIRQWVLLTYNEFEGLIIYRCKDAYLRFCSSQYSLESLQLNRHLTNYTLNRTNDNSQLTILLSQFFEIQTDYSSYFYTQLDSIIINAITANSNWKFQSNCFQLLGFDILIDEQLKLWLIEINSNPDCQHRRYTKLASFSQDIVKDMMNVIFRKESLQQENQAQQIQQNRFSNSWQAIYHPYQIEKRQDMTARKKPKKKVTSFESTSLLKQVLKRKKMGQALQNIEKQLTIRPIFTVFVQNLYQILQQSEKEKRAQQHQSIEIQTSQNQQPQVPQTKN